MSRVIKECPYTKETMDYVCMRKYLDDMGNIPADGRYMELYPMNFLPNKDECYTHTKMGSLFGYEIVAPQGTSKRPPLSDLARFKLKLRSLLDE